MLNVAVIGTGNMGKHHVRNYHEIKSTNLVAISDLNEDAGKPLAEKFNCIYYKDFEEMLNSEKIDAVSIVVPTTLHKKIALKVIERGINVLIEKPIADTLENAQEIIDAAKEKGVKLLVGHIERYNPAVNKLKKVIDSGAIGKLHTVIARRVGIYPPQVKDSDVVIDLAVHDIDILNFLIGNLPDNVTSNCSNALTDNRNDYADIFLKYGDTSAFVQVNWITPIKIRKLNVTGNKGYAEMDYITQEIEVFESNYTTKVDDYNDHIVKFSNPDKKKVDVEKEQPLKLEILDFINAIENDADTIVSVEDAYNVLKIALSIVVKKD